MSIGLDLLKDGKYQDMWERYCGFLDLSMDEFMAMQKHLLLEQIQLLRECPMGDHLMRGETPNTVDEFREQVPLTNYEDHAPLLKEQREGSLPAKPERLATPVRSVDAESPAMMSVTSGRRVASLAPSRPSPFSS